MNEKLQEENEKEEIRRKILRMRDTIMDGLAGKACTWQDLTQLSLIAISEADWYLEQKEYRFFGLYLQLYSDIWRYAYSHLKLRDYQYFCQSQDWPSGDYLT